MINRYLSARTSDHVCTARTALLKSSGRAEGRCNSKRVPTGSLEKQVCLQFIQLNEGQTSSTKVILVVRMTTHETDIEVFQVIQAGRRRQNNRKEGCVKKDAENCRKRRKKSHTHTLKKKKFFRLKEHTE